MHSRTLWRYNLINMFHVNCQAKHLLKLTVCREQCQFIGVIFKVEY
jgi:hypothetical protein